MVRRTENRLNVKQVAALKKRGRHADGNGLYLQISASGAKSWIFMYSWEGKSRTMGLGSVSVVSLAEARDQAAQARKVVFEGRDPITEKKIGGLKRLTMPTFIEFARQYIEEHAKSWKNAKHRAQWSMTIEEYAKPLHNLKIGDIETWHIVECLKPIWTKIPETAQRLRGRIEAILDAAVPAGYREGLNPARWKGHLKHLLAKPKKLTRGRHPSMPYKDVPDFLERLRARRADSARALEFHILTVARPGMVEAADPAEIDIENAQWVVPAHKMKGHWDEDFIIPLTPRALAIAKEQLRKARKGVLFYSERPGHKMSSSAMRALMARMGVSEYVPHGFRTSFRSWAADETTHERETAELVLAHKVGDETEQAYWRTTMLRKRRALMLDWEAYLEGREIERPIAKAA